MNTHFRGARGSVRPHSRGSRSGNQHGRSRSPHQRHSHTPHGVGGVIEADDIGDTIITVGTDTSDLPETHDVASGEVSTSNVRPLRASRTHSHSHASHERRSRTWSPEQDRGNRQRGHHNTSRSGGRGSYAPRREGGYGNASRGRGDQGRGGMRRGRRFVAPDLDIERFIEKSKREIDVQKRESAHTPAYTVQNNFASLITHHELRAQVAKKGYSTPTPIQDRAIPHVRERKDIVGIANTGTGKTAAFLVPLIDRALHHPHERTLVVVPTRELATQIGDEFNGFTRGLSREHILRAAVVIGGANIRPQIMSLRGARFVIGTPGRLKDLIERKALDMKSFTAIVLDEADRMLDMGFIPDIRFLMERMHHERHSLCFSATMPPEIEKLIGEFLNDPIHVSTKTGTTSHSVDQGIVRITEGNSKYDLLLDLLRDPSLERVIVFGETKRGVERLARQLEKSGVKAESIHGNKSSSQRKRALDAFKYGKVRVLVATDVAARGLDITNVSHVINYDVPHSYEDYVHRIGRTGRGGKEGKALTFVEGR
jgi:ATP-dependent RNA helicase RhlE